MNFEEFLNEEVKSAMQAAKEAYDRQVEEITRDHHGSERVSKLKAAHDSHEKRKMQIRTNLQMSHRRNPLERK